jgi:hypothetical protein
MTDAPGSTYTSDGIPTVLAWDEGFDERSLAGPEGADVDAVIAALNGLDRTLVTIYRGEAHLAVGGSARSGLVVYCTCDNQSFWELVNDGEDETAVTVVAGGQPGSYGATCVVPVGLAAAAAGYFLDRGGRAPGLRWEAR